MFCPLLLGLSVGISEKSLDPSSSFSPQIQVFIHIEEILSIPPEPSLLQAEQTQLSQSFYTAEVPQPSDHSLWPSSGFAPTGLCPHYIEGLRSRCSTPGRVFWEQSRWGESPSSTCCPHSFLCSWGYGCQYINILMSTVCRYQLKKTKKTKKQLKSEQAQSRKRPL